MTCKLPYHHKHVRTVLTDTSDGRAVTSESQLAAIPDFIEPYTAEAMTSEVGVKLAQCEKLPCQSHGECKPYGCNNCLWTSQYCTPGGCVNYYRCRDSF